MPRFPALRRLRRHFRIFVGLAIAGSMVWMLTHRGDATNWSDRALERFAVRDYDGCVLASDRSLEHDPSNWRVMQTKAQALWELHLFTRAIDALDKAISVVPTNVPLIVMKAVWLAATDHNAESVALLDDAIKQAPDDFSVIGTAATQRLVYANKLIHELTVKLETVHPDRIDVEPRIEEHLRSERVNSAARRELIAGVAGEPLKQDLDAKLQKAWSLLREADQQMGDIRTRRVDDPALRMARAELDLKFGKLLRAKEELQCLLQTSMLPTLRQKALGLLAEVLRQNQAHASRAAYLRELVELVGGERVAPLSLLADVYEAEFDAATQFTDRRAAFFATIDAHLRKYRNVDMRSCGWRGVAALRFKNDAKDAIPYLSDVYEALRINKEKDKSILRPDRAETFMQALLDAYVAAGESERGLPVVNSLLEVAANDPELHRKRARLLAGLGRYAEAADDLLVAMRHSKLDWKLFDEWLEMNDRVQDGAGRTPRQIAHDYAERLKSRLVALRKELEAQTDDFDVRTLRNSPKTYGKKVKRVADAETVLATSPIVAWHLSEELGRMGYTEEARSYLFKSVAIEPDVPMLRFRLSQLRLDLGMYREAARDFELILERDPTNVEVAFDAWQAWRLAGDLEHARQLRSQTIAASPERAGLFFCVMSCIEVGALDRAHQIIGPYLGRKDADIEHLLGITRFADEKWAAAADAMQTVLDARPDSAEAARVLVLSRAELDDKEAFATAAGKFVNLPRLLPSVEIFEILDRLEKRKLLAEAGVIASQVADRYPPDVALALKSRGALDQFRAGDSSGLRALRNAIDQAPELDDDVVRAAFGLTLREDGATAAATWLQRAREYTDRRQWAALPIAAAFALTPYRIDLGTFLSRYEREYGEQAKIPRDDAIAWLAARSRAVKPGDPPDVEKGSEGEQGWLKDALTLAPKPGDTPIAELVLNFWLYRFAGPGFEADAAKWADKLLAADKHALSAARFLAERREGTEGSYAAAAWLLDRYQASPTDQPTYDLLGRLMVASEGDGTVLKSLAESGRELFPASLQPLIFQAEAARKAKEWPAAAEALEAALAIDPKDATVLSRYAAIAREANDEAIVGRACAAIVASGSREEDLRSLLLLRYRDAENLDADAITVLTPLVDADPTFYAGAQRLVVALHRTGDFDAVEKLAKRLIEVIPADPGAAKAGDLFAAIARLLIVEKKYPDTQALIDLGLLADPSNLQLRGQHVQYVQLMQQKSAAIDDLELLCVLAPKDPDLLFSYSDILLTERTDKASVVTRLVPLLAEIAPKDPRRFDLNSKLKFRHDDIAQAGLEMVKALQTAAYKPELWYRYGVLTLLSHNRDQALLAFGKVKQPDFAFAPRVKQLLELLDAPGP